jgi:hypothetical protein
LAKVLNGDEGVFNDKKITIPIRILSEKEAEQIVGVWSNGSRDGYKALKLFGSNATPTWTVAIMSGLKPMGRKIQRGKLRWILSTAMPLRDDFKLFLDGDRVQPSKGYSAKSSVENREKALNWWKHF